MVGYRHNPVAGLVAFVATAVGLCLMVFGFVAPGSLGGCPWASSGDIADLFTTLLLVALGLVLIVPTWFVFIRVMISHHRERAQVLSEAQHDVTQPPTNHDPAVVAVLVGDGHPAHRAIAGTVLDLAHRHVLSINEYGPRVVVHIDGGATAASRGEQLVLDALRSQARDGNVEGPPIWPGRIRWWHAFARDACDRAVAAGLLAPRVPPIGAMLVGILTATGLAVMFWNHTAVFIGAILFANGLPQLLAHVSGYHLTVPGLHEKALWEAFGRYLHQDRSLRDVGPAGIAMWGPNLTYGAVLGETPKAAVVLTPGATEKDTEAASGVVV